MVEGPGFHNRHAFITSKICSLLISLTQEPSEYDKIAPNIEYWIEYVLREQFTTVDELVEAISWVAWNAGDTSENIARFLKEFRDAPCRSDQARFFVIKLCDHVLRWFAIASVEDLPIGESQKMGSIATWGGSFTRAASFVGHLIGYGLLGHDLVRRHLVKPLISHRYVNRSHPGLWLPGEAARANAIHRLFIAAGNTLLQGLLAPEDVQACFETLDVDNTSRTIEGLDAGKLNVRFSSFQCLVET